MKEQKKQALASYVKKQLKSGKDLQTLREELESKKWSDKKISAVFQAAGLDENDFQAAQNEEDTQPEEQNNYSVDPFMNVDDTPDSEGVKQTDTKEQAETTTKEPPHPSYEQKTSENRQQTQTREAGVDGESDNQDVDSRNQEPQIGTFKPKTAGSDSSQNGSWSTAGLTGLLIGVFLVVGVGSGLAYVNLVNNSPNKPPSAEEVYTAHRAVDSLRYDTSLHAELDLNAEALRTRDDFDRFKQALPYIPHTGRIGNVPQLLQGELSVGGFVNLSEQNSNGETTVRLAFGGSKLKNILDVELRYLEETGYVKAKTLPSVPMLPLQSYEKQWFSFTASSTPGQLQSVQDSAGDAKLREDSVRKIIKAARTTGLVSEEETSDGTLTNGGDAHIYTLTIHPKNHPPFVQRVETIVSENQPELANRREFQDAVSELKDTTSTDRVPDEVGPIKVWVAADSKRLRKIKYEKTYTKQDIKGMSDTNNASDNLVGLNSAAISLVATLDDYNRSADIKEPTNTTPIKEAMQNMPFFGRMSSARKSARDARRQTDINQLRTALALYQNDCGQMPEAANAVDITGSLGSGGDCSLKEFMSSIPSDPSDETPYVYTTDTSAGDFCIGASLEDESSLPDNNNDQCVEELRAAGAEDINYAISN